LAAKNSKLTRIGRNDVSQVVELGRSSMTNPLEQWIQVSSEAHYDALAYLSPQRMASIAYQFRLAAKHFPNSSVLEVGIGAGLSTALLRQSGHRVTTVDVDARLRPDRLGSITALPCSDEEFDTCLCCQVLEHLPWQSVKLALNELYRVATLGSVISVPTNQPTWLIMKYDARSWGTRRLRLPNRANKPLRLSNGEHYWELESNVSTGEFRALILASGFDIACELQPVENMYHHFFVLTKRTVNDTHA
jgi:ubiquinone/menaquinone biosynthesis C-methylase UbiE